VPASGAQRYRRGRNGESRPTGSSGTIRKVLTEVEPRPCRCPAYPFPHRPGGGRCQSTPGAVLRRSGEREDQDPQRSGIRAHPQLGPVSTDHLERTDLTLGQHHQQPASHLDICHPPAQEYTRVNSPDPASKLRDPVRQIRGLDTVTRSAEDLESPPSEQVAAWRAMSSARRLELAFQAYQFALDAVRLTEQRRHPDLSPNELCWRITRRMQGDPRLGR